MDILDVLDSGVQIPFYRQELPDFFSPLYPYDFRPERLRDQFNGNGIVYPSDMLRINEDILDAFKQCYDNGSIDSMIEEHGFSPSQYLGLFLVQGFECAPDMTISDKDDMKIRLFLEWAYENRYSFDASEISGNLTGCIEDKSFGMWNMVPETISLEMMHTYISCLNSSLDNLNQLDKCVRSKDRSPEMFLFYSIGRSIKRHLKDNMLDSDLLFKTLKQKHQNRYAPYLFMDIAAFSEEWNLTERYRFMMLHVLELFSVSYLKRDMNGTLDRHKSDLQKIYESFGGEINLFPHQEYIEKPSDEGTIWMRTRGSKHKGRRPGVIRIRVHNNQYLH